MNKNKKVPARWGNTATGRKDYYMKNTRRYCKSQGIFRSCCGIGAFLVLILILGTMGGIEQGFLSLKLGSWLAVGETALFAALVLLSGGVKL